MQLNNQAILSDLLFNIKAISINYHAAVLESANDNVRNILIQLNNEEINLQRQVFNLMRDRNWLHFHSESDNTSALKPDKQQLPY